MGDEYFDQEDIDHAIRHYGHDGQYERNNHQISGKYNSNTAGAGFNIFSMVANVVIAFIVGSFTHIVVGFIAFMILVVKSDD